jgi:hypothetical protein
MVVVAIIAIMVTVPDERPVKHPEVPATPSFGYETTGRPPGA